MSFQRAAPWFNPCSSSSDEEEEDRRYRTTHQSRAKQRNLEQRASIQDLWSWEQIFNGEGPWAKVNHRPWERLEAARRAEENRERNRRYEGTRLARKPEKPKSSLEGTLADTQKRYSAQLAGLQSMVTSLELQLSQLHANIAHNKQEYDMLLNLKTRLEMEIAEYRRLLHGEDDSSTQVVTKTITVTQTIVDGKVMVLLTEPPIKIMWLSENGLFGFTCFRDINAL
ncbi:uncharacterized protein ACWYII_003608 [Salvelinus alpinus]